MNKNEKLNEARQSVNNNISKYGFLGRAKGRVWNGMRKWRTI